MRGNDFERREILLVQASYRAGPQRGIRKRTDAHGIPEHPSHTHDAYPSRSNAGTVEF